MNITGGKYKSRKIKTIEGRDVRPTLSKVRESIFNVLQTKIIDAVMLDGFAWSGIMGIEGASRGAKKVIFIEKNPSVARILKDNIQNFDFDNEVYIKDTLKALKTFEEESFDVIFLDPPYDTELLFESLKLIQQNRLLKKDGIIICEVPKARSTFALNGEELQGFQTDKVKTYGDTAILFLSFTHS